MLPDKILGFKVTGYEILDVKKVAKRGGSWQVTLPPDLVEYLGLKKEKRGKIVFLQDIDTNVFYIFNARGEL